MKKLSVTLLLIILLLFAGCGEFVSGPSANGGSSTEGQVPAQSTESLNNEQETETSVDSDSDGLLDDRERELGTDPLDNDSDNDGVNDGTEINQGTDPTIPDTDGDGLTDKQELNGDTNATVADTDGDGLADGPEVNNYGTNPIIKDTDNDSLTDGEEINQYGSDPKSNDTDGDGLTDREEINQYQTNVSLADTDNDGLSDSVEIRKYGTDPVVNDTDSDGLTDGREVSMSTDPNDADTDGDGLPDGAEVDMTKRFPNADPLQKDLFLEVDYMSRLDDSDIRDMREEFESAPVSNPDGSTGIDLHVYMDDYIRCEEASGTNRGEIQYGCKYKGSKIKNEDNKGYYYIQIVSTVLVPSRQSFTGGVALGRIAFVQNYEDRETASILMHELGHLLNIRNAGVDNTNKGYSEYNSVMNYLAPDESIKYAQSDWKDVNESLPYVPGATHSEILNQTNERE